jgi:hypothetical protein
MRVLVLAEHSTGTVLKAIQQQTLEGHSCLEHFLDRNFPVLVVKNVKISLCLIKLHA